MRTVRYREIADDLRRRLDAGEPAAGRLLPSEAELARAYAVSRVTVRRALEALRTEGRVDARQGLGWFVATEPVAQELGRLATLEAQLEASGRVAERRVRSFAHLAPPGWVAEVLGGGEVLEVRRLNLADGQPFARVTVWCRGDLGAGLSKADVARSPFYELLPVELGGARQTIAAAACEPGDAEDLGVPVGAPVLRCRRTTTDAGGVPVLVSEHVFPAHRTEFVVDLARPRRSIAPTGLRLVE